MKKAIALIIFLVAISSHAVADDGFAVRASLAIADYSIKSDVGHHWSGNLKLLTIGGSYAIGDSLLDLSYTSALSGKVDFERNGFTDSDESLKRRDIVFTYSHPLYESASGFIGLKAAESKIDTGINTKFSNMGVFAGIGIPFGSDPHHFAVSLALGIMKGKWTDDIPESAESDITYGLSAGAGYSYKFSSSVSAGVDVKYQSYQYDFTSQLGYKVKEDIATYGVTVKYSF